MPRKDILRIRLKRGRKDAKVSLSEAAHRIGCTKAHLWELEDGRADNPGLKLLRSIAKVYGVSVAWLIGEDERGLYQHAPRFIDEVSTWAKEPRS